MKGDRWTIIGLGSLGVLVLISRTRNTLSGGVVLGSPVEVVGAPRVTPHGYFAAPRAGPPIHTHQGLDLAAPPGSRVLAVGDGRIVKTDPGLGKIVRKLQLDAPGAWAEGGPRASAIVYADLGRPLVQPGDRVRRGEAIALVGASGFVHFATKEVRDGREVFFDPKLAGFAYRKTEHPAPRLTARRRHHGDERV